MADKLTDEELVRELQAFGETVKLPLKAVKRGVLVKKLNHLRVKSEKARSEVFKKPAPVGRGRRAARSPRSPIASFSSDESDVGEADTSESLTGRRKQNSTSRRSSTRLSTVLDAGRNAVRRGSPVTNSGPQIEHSTDYASKLPSRNSSTLEPSASDAVTTSTSPSSSLGTGLSNIRNTIFPAWNRNANHNNKSLDFDSSDSDIGEGSTYEVESRGINTTFNLDESDNASPARASLRTGSSPVNWPRNRKSVGNSVPYSTNSSDSPKTSTPVRGKWYLSGENHSPAEKSHTPNSSPSVIRQQLNSSTQSNHVNTEKIADDQRLRNVFKEKEQLLKTSYTHHISMILLLIVGVFFLVLGVLYLSMRSVDSFEYTSADSKAEDDLLICTEWQKAMSKSEGNGNPKPCFEESVSRLGLKAVIPLYDELSHRMGDYKCAKRPSGNMSRTELTSFLDDVLVNKLNITDQKGLMYTDVVISLIIHNPHWHLRALKTEEEAAKDMSEAEQVIWLQSSMPYMSFSCRLWKAIQLVTSRILLAVSVLVFLVISGAAIAYIVHYRVKQQEKEQRLVFNMVEKIIDVLKLHCETLHDEEDSNTFLAIQHVRDTLIPPAERKQNQSIWDKAVKFVELHESRVRVETQTIHGEDFTVWRWLQNCPKGQKVWQGQAFGEDKLNHVAKSPSACLKVSNMFNADKENEEDWDISVKDAILEKCTDCQIVHLHVDRGSSEGVVYVKCSDEVHAGKAFKQLHGWWFDGKLVTVKYLKTEHYSRSFPKSITSTNPLQPTTDRKLSLAQPFHRSSLEMT